MLKCGACKRMTKISLNAKIPKCKECGHSLPTRPLKVARRPELMMVNDALQACHQGEKESCWEQEESWLHSPKVRNVLNERLWR
jgi:hypothetical protein